MSKQPPNKLKEKEELQQEAATEVAFKDAGRCGNSHNLLLGLTVMGIHTHTHTHIKLTCGEGWPDLMFFLVGWTSAGRSAAWESPTPPASVFLLLPAC